MYHLFTLMVIKLTLVNIGIQSCRASDLDLDADVFSNFRKYNPNFPFYISHGVLVVICISVNLIKQQRTGKVVLWFLNCFCFDFIFGSWLLLHSFNGSFSLGGERFLGKSENRYDAKRLRMPKVILCQTMVFVAQFLKSKLRYFKTHIVHISVIF